MRFNIIIAIGVLVVLLVGVGSAGFTCDSAATGDGVNVNTEYSDTASQSMTAYTAMMASKAGAYQSSQVGSSGAFAHATTATVDGFYKDGMATVQQEVSGNSCGACGESTEGKYSQAMFSTKTTGKATIQSGGYVGTGMYGTSYVTGTGSSRITAGSMDITKYKETTYSHSVKASGSGYTNWMSFDWQKG